ncbi:MAG TPA: SH3 domain-containing protein [Thermomicrobiales bacterium]|nr:SH3 domain-containing protein [Thermomicrobiales bacterium]
MNPIVVNGPSGMVARGPQDRLTTTRRPYRLVTYVSLVAMLFAGFFAIPGVARAASDQTTSSVNFRTGPGTDYPSMTVIPSDASVEILGDPENGFYPIRYNDATGYVSSDYLSTGTSDADSGGDAGSSDVQSGGPTGTAYVIDGALNLRDGASLSASVILVMPGDATVTLNGDSSNGFYGVTYKGTDGWASADFISQDAPAAETPAPTDPPVAETPAPTDPPTVKTPVPTQAPATEAPVDNGNSGSTDIVSIIYAAADRYGQSRADMLRVATCESNLDPNAVNPSSGTSGLFQFMPSTWASTPYADQSIFDAYANANAAGWMWSVGRRGEWQCQ